MVGGGSASAAAAEINVNTMTAPLGIRLLDAPPLLHFARRLDVVVWPPQRVSPLAAEGGQAGMPVLRIRLPM